METTSFRSIHMLALVWIIAVFALALAAPLLALQDPTAISLAARLQPPIGWGGSWQHPFGTDALGRDMFSRTVYALRLSLSVALLGTFMGGLIGTSLGFVAAQAGGLVEGTILGLIDLQAAIPFFIIAMAFMAFLGTDLSILLLVVSIYGWERYARLARVVALSTTQGGVVAAARGYGAGPVRIYLRHILPAAMTVLLVNATLNFSETILLESTLSFLGLGVQPPHASLGSIMSYGRDYLISAWWICLIPGVVVALTTLSFALLGDVIRERHG